MDQGRFDSLARSLATAKTRRGVLGGLAALAVGARAAAAQSACPILGQIRNKKGDCSCPAGTDACPDGCFDTKSDLTNCGSCGHACGEGQICQKGGCKCPRGATCCPPGQVGDGAGGCIPIPPGSCWFLNCFLSSCSWIPWDVSYQECRYLDACSPGGGGGSGGGCYNWSDGPP